MGHKTKNITGNHTKDSKDYISLNTSMINGSTVLAGMSHEVRTFMNAIVGFSFLMKNSGCSDAEREEFNNQILASCDKLLSLFENFFDSVCIDTGNSQTELKVCRLNTFLDELLPEFREIIKKEENKDVVLISENNLTDALDVIIDSDRVFRVIRNLVQNAVNNTKSGYIKIGYSFRDSEVNFYVLDSGQGYFKSKEFLHTEDLNESLSKYNDTASAINLTLAKKLIQILNGSLWIGCNGLTGTGVYFTVPVKVAKNSDISINKYLNSTIAI